METSKRSLPVALSTVIKSLFWEIVSNGLVSYDIRTDPPRCSPAHACF